MESHEVLRDAFEKTSPKEIAASLNVSLSLVYKWSQPPEEDGAGSGSRNPLDRTAELMRLTGDPNIVKWLCQRAGGHFVANPPPAGQQPRELGLHTNEIIQQFADLLEAITTAAVDRKITADEAKSIRGHWDDLKTCTEGFVRACEAGDFDHLPRR